MVVDIVFALRLIWRRAAAGQADEGETGSDDPVRPGTGMGFGVNQPHKPLTAIPRKAGTGRPRLSMSMNSVGTPSKLSTV